MLNGIFENFSEEVFPYALDLRKLLKSAIEDKTIDFNLDPGLTSHALRSSSISSVILSNMLSKTSLNDPEVSDDR